MLTDNYIMRFAALFGCAFGVTFLLEPLVIRWARRFAIIDSTNWRKVHTNAMVRAGGFVFFPSLIVALIVVLWIWPALWRERYLWLVTAALVVTLTGIWDDIFGMRAPPKLALQFLAATILYAGGYQLHSVSVPFTNVILNLGVMDLFVTIIAVAAIINAINMIDGLDGLAAGCAFIMCGFMLFNKLAQGAADSAIVLVITMGMALAFLVYNFHPAKIFMGDTGSMFLGLILASELLDSASQGAAVTTLLLPLAILGIPVFDMLRTVVTRARAGRSLFSGDKNHLHYRLLHLGLSHRKVVLFIYAMNVYMGIMAIVYKHVEVAYRGLFLTSMGLFLFIAFYLVIHRNNSDTAQSTHDE